MPTKTIVPIALWGARHVHEATCIALIEEKNEAGETLFVTGGMTNEVIIWRYKGGAITGSIILVGHTQRVVSVKVCSMEDEKVVVSLALNGELKMWSASDGAFRKECNLGSSSFMKAHGMAVFYDEMKARNVCCVIGASNKAFLVDLGTMKAFTAVEIHKNWIVHICVPSDFGSNVVATSSRDGSVKIWDQTMFLNEDSFSQDLQPSHHLTDPKKENALSISYSRTGMLLAVVYKSHFSVFSGTNYECLVTEDAPENISFTGCCFLNEKSIVVWTASGLGMLFTLVHNRMEFGQSHSMSLIATFQNSDDSHLCVATNNQEIFVTASAKRVSVWDMSGFKESGSPRSMKPLASKMSTFDFEESVDMKNLQTTCSTIVEDAMLLFRGYDNGMVSSQVIPGDLFPNKVKAHQGRVTYLFSPKFNHSSNSFGRFLISNGSDYAVKVWDLFSLKLLHSFHQHCGEVAGMVVFEKNFSDDLVLSVGKDRSVAIFSMRPFACTLWLPGHSGNIVAVYYCEKQDVLVVVCSDSLCFFWEYSSGKLLTKTTEMEAIMFLKQECTMVYHEKTLFVNSSGSPTSGISSTCKPPRDRRSSPIQVMMLNIPSILSVLASYPTHVETLVLQKDRTTMRDNVCFAPMSIISFFIPWGIDKRIDDLCKHELMIPRPCLHYSLGFSGSAKNLNLSAPPQNMGDVYNTCPAFTSQGLVACMSLIWATCCHDARREAYSRLIGYIMENLARDNIPHFVKPSVEHITAHWLAATTMEFELKASRIFANAGIDLIRCMLSNIPADKVMSMYSDLRTSNSQSSLFLGTLLAFFRKEAFDVRRIKVEAQTLIEELCSEANRLPTVAASVLSIDYPFWAKHIEEPYLVVKKMLDLNANTVISTATRSFLLESLLKIAAQDALLVLTAVSSEKFFKGRELAVLDFLAALTSEWIGSVQDCLIMVVELCLKLMNPSQQKVRDQCVAKTIKVINNLVKVFPVTAFHTGQHQMAVACEDAIFAYNLTDAQLFLSCKSKGLPLAMVFSENAKYLAVLCANGTVEFWQTKSFFSTFVKASMKTSPHHITQIPRAVLPKRPTPDVKLRWDSMDAVILYISGDPPMKVSTGL